MEQAHPNDSRTGRTLAIVGGGAVLLWWLLRGGDGTGGTSQTTSAAPTTPCRVRIDSDGIQVDGARVDVAGLVSTCRARRAEVLATGAARTGTVADAMHALADAGVAIHAHPDVWSAAGMAPRNAAPRSLHGLAASIAAPTLFLMETSR